VSGFKTLLFDNDGVLVDTEDLYYEVTRDVLAEAGIELSRELHVDVSLKQGRGLFDLAVERGFPEKEVEAMRDRRNGIYLSLLEERSESLVIPGVKEALEALKPGRTMAIVTSCRPDHFKAIHSRSGLLELFDFVIGQCDYENHKPHPEPYLAALKRAGSKAGDALVVEDAERGVESAAAAGIRCVAIPRGIAACGDFSKAWKLFKSLEELRFFMESAS